MKIVLATVTAIGLLAIPVSASATAAPGFSSSHVRHGGVRGGRWIWGSRAPGGWGGYRPAVRGWVLPRYWIAPRFIINDYRRYGFPAPRAGHGWSRYYDDAVLSDRDGRVIETRQGVEWDDRDDYDDRYENGPWGGGEIVTTTTIQPKTVTVTTITEEWVPAPSAPRKRLARRKPSKLLRR